MCEYICGLLYYYVCTTGTFVYVMGTVIVLTMWIFLSRLRSYEHYNKIIHFMTGPLYNAPIVQRLGLLLEILQTNVNIYDYICTMRCSKCSPFQLAVN